MERTRGFVTIATGHERYYVLARNLLFSYRQFAEEKIPFAIIADRENQYTAEFDQVLILQKPANSFMDKLKLYDFLPYDETIFIDADSLAYGDLNEWWGIFKNAPDFCCFGYAWKDLNAGRGWFIPSGIKEYQDKVSFVPDFNGGIYFMRRSETCEKVFRLANYFAEHFHDYQFTGFSEPADEPCLALAMAVFDCCPIDILDGGLVFAPPLNQMEADITVPKAVFRRKDDISYGVNLIHWSNYRTKQSFYKFEVEKLLLLREKRTTGLKYKLLYACKLRYYFLRIGDIGVFGGRVFRKIRKILSSKNSSLKM